MQHLLTNTYLRQYQSIYGITQRDINRLKYYKKNLNNITTYTNIMEFLAHKDELDMMIYANKKWHYFFTEHCLRIAIYKNNHRIVKYMIESDLMDSCDLLNLFEHASRYEDLIIVKLLFKFLEYRYTGSLFGAIYHDNLNFIKYINEFKNEFQTEDFDTYYFYYAMKLGKYEIAKFIHDNITNHEEIQRMNDYLNRHSIELFN